MNQVDKNVYSTLEPIGLNHFSEFQVDLADEESPFPASINIFRTLQPPKWTSSLPALTVPDLADTVEQMLARRTSGLTTSLTGPGLRIRQYPVDPSSVVEAGQMLKALQEVAQNEVDATKAQIKQRRQDLAQKNAIAKQEAEEFAKFKASKQG